MFVCLAGLTRRGLRGAILFSALALLAACGPGNRVDIQYHGYTIQPSRGALPAGDIVFNITNQDGQVLHQLLVVQTDAPADKLPLGADNKVDETGLKIVARVDKVDVGQTSTLTAHLAPGHYVLLCNLVGHYQLGMRADLNVTQ
jgi:uncharacterized cupredoxin-like copper-binding protein